MIRFSPEECTDPDFAGSREWLETNGIGGFASSTIIGLNTRKYHGLLVAATRPPVGRMLLLSKLEETVLVDGRRLELSANQYPGVIYPKGYQFLKEFRLDPFPTFVYDLDGMEFEKRLFLVHGENTLVVEYELRGPARECQIEIRPLIAFRDYHSLTHRNSALNPAVRNEANLATVQPYESLTPLHFAHNADEILPTGDWYLNFEYKLELARGLDYQEDLFNPFVALFNGRTARFVISTQERSVAEAEALERAEVQRRTSIRQAAPVDHPLVIELTAAADQFLVKRDCASSVIAGYPWFADWGRDTMIALPGLTLVTGRHDVARSILSIYSRFVDQGMLPNRFPDSGEAPEYNTVDAALWFFEATRAYLGYSGDIDFVSGTLYPVLASIIDWYMRGTRLGISIDRDGLVNCGDPDTQLTWMDAKAGGHAVTPRNGKPVEVQALWYNALCVMESLAMQRGDAGGRGQYRRMSEQARASFRETFWNEEDACLFDVTCSNGKDRSMRPNQIFAVSLPHCMLTTDQAASVVAAVERELLTPMGLRTLSKSDSRYRPRYEGSVFERDSAYHQGTVWPWLMGPFLTAYLRVHGRSEESRRTAAQWLDAFAAHLREAGVGQISELADGDAPHYPRGCIAQAWSVGEILRAAVEDVLRV
jgi:predicted glycogen debranching enzyme